MDGFDVEQMVLCARIKHTPGVQAYDAIIQAQQGHRQKKLWPGVDGMQRAEQPTKFSWSTSRSDSLRGRSVGPLGIYMVAVL